ncbi:sugar kinase [Aureimonas mangrovi]|uniref:sugar kinase n=1 Tax=Aureimonas mangrovi TaxID=2758041 RepID=UPI00163DBA00|nr:sugar kinase [Aureimonas mangrovi]
MLQDTPIACIGECMVEFRQVEGGLFAPGFGGDTLNTAAYLARLGAKVDYITALGDDVWSDEMLAAWQAEGVGTCEVLRVEGASPGLYVIQVDARGERRFSYWRDSAPARRLFDLPQSAQLAKRLSGYGLLYFSGISLSLYGKGGRMRLFETLAAAREAGARIAFDTNFRPRGWPDRGEAVRAFREALSLSDIVFASVEDLVLLFGEDHAAVLLEAAPQAERVVKHDDLAVEVSAAGVTETVRGAPAERVVDTTAAGDSFAAAYLAARLSGSAAAEAAAAGHRLAGRVVGFPGALMPKTPLDDILGHP